MNILYIAWAGYDLNEPTESSEVSVCINPPQMEGDRLGERHIMAKELVPTISVTIEQD